MSSLDIARVFPSAAAALSERPGCAHAQVLDHEACTPWAPQPGVNLTRAAWATSVYEACGDEGRALLEIACEGRPNTAVVLSANQWGGGDGGGSHTHVWSTVRESGLCEYETPEVGLSSGSARSAWVWSPGLEAPALLQPGEGVALPWPRAQAPASAQGRLDFVWGVLADENCTCAPPAPVARSMTPRCEQSSAFRLRDGWSPGDEAWAAIAWLIVLVSYGYGVWSGSLDERTPARVCVEASLLFMHYPLQAYASFAVMSWAALAAGAVTWTAVGALVCVRKYVDKESIPGEWKARAANLLCVHVVQTVAISVVLGATKT